MLPVLLSATMLGGCFSIAKPVDFVVESALDLPEFGPDTFLQVALYSTARSARTQMEVEPDCLEDPGWCDITISVDGLGHKDIEAWFWLDVDGDDGADLYRVLLDQDPLGYTFVHVPSMPYDEPLEVVLDDPRLVIEGED